MRQLVVAVCVGAVASVGGLLTGVSQPGSWVAEVTGGSPRGYDIYIHDHYFIVKPAILLVNFIAFSMAAYLAVWLWRRRSGGLDGGAGA